MPTITESRHSVARALAVLDTLNMAMEKLVTDMLAADELYGTAIEACEQADSATSEWVRDSLLDKRRAFRRGCMLLVNTASLNPKRVSLPVGWLD